MLFLNSYCTRREAGLDVEHTAMVSGKGRDITAAGLTATAATRGVPENKVRAMFFLRLEKDFKHFFEYFFTNRLAIPRNGCILMVVY